jgi:hypothetical protein
MDFAVNQRLNLSERNCINLYERYRIEPETSLQKNIVVLEKALDGLQELETNLVNLKTEIKKTSEKSARIKNEYEETLKLKDITEEQLSIIRKSLNTQNTSKMILNAILGFIFGVASSITGTVIYEKRKRYKMLQ